MLWHWRFRLEEQRCKGRSCSMPLGCDPMESSSSLFGRAQHSFLLPMFWCANGFEMESWTAACLCGPVCCFWRGYRGVGVSACVTMVRSNCAALPPGRGEGGCEQQDRLSCGLWKKTGCLNLPLPLPIPISVEPEPLALVCLSILPGRKSDWPGFFKGSGVYGMSLH